MTESPTKGLYGFSTASRTALAAILLAAACLLAYSNTFDATFHYDDNHQIVDNPHIRDVSNLPRFFTDSGLSSYRPDRTHYRPVLFATYALNHAVGGYDVRGYHAVNLGLHAANSLLVFLLAGMVLGRAGRRDGPAVFFVPLLAGTLFALHPVETYAVTYISGRAPLLAVFFCLLSLISFVRFREGAGRTGHAWASAFFFLLGVMSKEFAASLPAFFAAYDMVFTPPGLSAPKEGGRRVRLRALAPYIAIIAACLVYLALRGHAETAVKMPDWEHGRVSYWLSEAGALLLYARLVLFPMNQNADYSLPPVISPTAASLGGLALAAAMLFGLYRLRRARPELSLFGLWFLAGFLLESVVVPITDIAVEYRLYMPMIGASCFAAAALADAVKQTAARRATAVTLLVIFGILTYNRNLVWATPYTLWGDVVKKAPHNDRAYVNYATALLDMGRYDEAAEGFRRVLAAGPDDEREYKAHNNLGTCYFMLGRLDLAEAEFAETLRLRPECAECLLNLGKVYYRQGRFGEAAEVLGRAAPLASSTPEARYLLAMSLRETGRKAEALREMEMAEAAGPPTFEVAYNLAVLYAEDGRFRDALAQAEVSRGLAADETQRALAEGLIGKLGARVK